MNKILLLFFHFSILWYCCRSSVMFALSDNSIPGSCYLKNKNLTIPEGKSITNINGKCNMVTCNYPMVDIAMCGVVIKIIDGEECRLAEDLSKPYPDCCISDKCAKN
ncbi:uncharacterized protein LOC108736261 [Agrilus planipennis]|uniref:Uncharacterized protein LOC108736261 n=1 Tax=Agrilus planipennis TaxID=224129 RepID=A0A1W4WJK6_AGRPL|nr:uncharacterized protein LOC108736261 [Agrilus planipennis]